MNATRAATIRGRVALSGLISLGRVQTPTLALLARREVEIQGFVPRRLLAGRRDVWRAGPRSLTWGAGSRGEETRLQTAEEAEAIVAKTRAKPGASHRSSARSRPRPRRCSTI